MDADDNSNSEPLRPAGLTGTGPGPKPTDENSNTEPLKPAGVVVPKVKVTFKAMPQGQGQGQGQGPGGSTITFKPRSIVRPGAPPLGPGLGLGVSVAAVEPKPVEPKPQQTVPELTGVVPELTETVPVPVPATEAPATRKSKTVKAPKAPKAPKEPKEVKTAAPKMIEIPPDAIETFAGVSSKKLAESYDRLTIRTRGKNPVGPTVRHTKSFVPVTSDNFPHFIIRTLTEYSNYADFAPGTEKPIDEDACKKRDPNKIETFFYQNIVRDYISHGTPYRGILVYHGLGSGKTCTSIAAAEALYWGGKKKIYVLTPASLANNYRKDLGRCGFFPLRQRNRWTFLKFASVGDAPYTFLTDTVGLPPDLVVAQGGGWVADPKPDAVSNWDTLSPAVRESIQNQQQRHLNFRFTFINYNGVVPARLADAARSQLLANDPVFDNSVVIIEEIHNLIRTINSTKMDKSKSKSIPEFIEKSEPREFTWRMGMNFKEAMAYNRGYTLYRLLQNAVGAKIIGLSATPMINYAQEFAVLMNVIGGEQRSVTLKLGPSATKRGVEQWAESHPEIDYYKFNDGAAKSVEVTPVPHNFVKVAPDPAAPEKYSARGFTRLPDEQPVASSRERNLDRWALTLLANLETVGFVEKGAAAHCQTEVDATRSEWDVAHKSTMRTSFTNFAVNVFPLLPDDGDKFVNTFIDRQSLQFKKLLGNGTQVSADTVLKQRITGLVSYYSGKSKDLMPRVGLNQLVEIPMSSHMFNKYRMVRQKEAEQEKDSSKKDKPGPGASAAAASGKKSKKAGVIDVYSQVVSVESGFKARTRTLSNWAFPDDVTSSKVLEDEKVFKTVYNVKEADAAADAADADVADSGEGILGEGEGEVAATAVAMTEVTAPAESLPYVAQVMKDLEAKGNEYFNAELETYSPKFAKILENIRKSKGPAMVYSDFLTLQGIGLFSAVLRYSDEKYKPLKLVLTSDKQWSISPECMVPIQRVTNDDGSFSWVVAPTAAAAAEGEGDGKEGEADIPTPHPRYIVYSGNESPEMRRLLIQIYNADLQSLPPLLSKQVSLLLGDAPDNRDGRVCNVFMLSKAGAEGISLFNTRQVHIMEPYWNNVRVQQVIGRAIRLCSHMNLPWDDRVVDIFTYLSILPNMKDVEGESATERIGGLDDGKSTDKIIFDIAVKKQVLANELERVLQESAIDCVLIRESSTIEKKCFVFKSMSRFMFNPNWEVDVQEAPNFSREAPAAAAAASVASASMM